jgi:GDP-L-fucose synthase
MTNKIMIFGGFGFLGKNLNETFKNSTFTIVNESRRSGCDLHDLDVLVATIKKINPDVIINAAADVGSITYVSTYAADVINNNSQMYLNLYKAIVEVNPDISVINPISNCSYPGIIDLQSESDWWNGPIHDSVESYGYPKKLGFITSKCYERQYGIKTTNVIIPNAYGPLDYTDPQKTHAMNGIIMRMLTAKKAGATKFDVWGSGKPIREWVYMLDVAKIFKYIVENPELALPNPINIGQNFGISINDTVSTIKSLLDYDVEIVHDLSKQDGAPIKVLDNTLFKKHFPNFSFTDYHTGIKNTITYYENLI